MQERVRLINYFKNKVKILKKHNYHYHSKDKPIISDQDFDNLKKELFDLEKNIYF